MSDSPLRLAGLLSLALLPLVAGCAAVAVASAPAKRALANPSAEAASAHDLFWQTFHSGDYAGIDRVLDALQVAYLAQPTDPQVAAHIGFLHIWRLAERAREATPDPTVTDHATLARRYFAEAHELDPSDARFTGFYAASIMAEADIHADEKDTRRGFFLMNDAVAAWPEFNLFTRGYVMSGLPASDRRFSDAIADQWETLDRCAETKVDRSQPRFASYLPLATDTGPKRACWNSWIAPHNLEGFFLNMGDMIVKSGDVAGGRRIYAEAQALPTYASWPHRETLEARIAQADENVAAFATEAERPMMFNAPFACMACHQADAVPAAAAL